MTNLTVIKQENKTILKDGRKIYATISYNKNLDYKWVLYLKNSIALSGYDSEQKAIDRANEMHNDFKNVLAHMKTFNELLQRKSEINKQVDFFSDQLQKFPKNEIGLIIDKTEKYKACKIGFNHWFKKLQEINLVINRNYKKENREYHLQIRNSKKK